MKKIASLLLLLFVLQTALSAAEQDTTDRLKVGLVLSGGGAKGVAHIGALQLIEELGIPVDYVVGTSIGSIVGGLYALGYDAFELDSLVRAQDWEMLMQDAISRKSTLFEDKKYNEKLLLRIPFMNRRSFSAEAAKIDEDNNGKEKSGGIFHNIPSALVEGQNLHALFTQLSVGYQDDVNFDDLPIPFACVAVDLNSKEEVVFRSGDIVNSIRASMSIPAYFAPVKYKDMFLVDGGMLNNFPVDVVREMGADIVIGVDLHQYDKVRTEKIENLGGMLGGLLAVMNGEKYNKGRESVDVLITPNTSDFGVLSFDEASVRALIDTGYVSALRHYDELAAVAMLEAGYEGRHLRHPKAINMMEDSIHIDVISIQGEGTSESERNWMMKKCVNEIGDVATGEEIDHLMESFYATNAFSKVAYSIVGGLNDSAYALKINLTPEMMHQVGLGLRFDTEDMASLLLNLSLNKHKMRGFKFDINTKLGANIIADANAAFAFNPSIQLNFGYRFRHSTIDFYSETKRIRSITLNNHDIDFNFEQKSRISDLRLGVKSNISRHTSYLSEYTSIDDDEELYKDRYFLAYASYAMDNRDRRNFATKGLNMEWIGEYAFAGSNNAQVAVNYADLRGNIEVYIPFGNRVCFIPQFAGRVLLTKGDEFSIYDNMAGGYEKGRYYNSQMTFVGSTNVYQMGDITGSLRTDLQVNIFKKHYLTAMANYLMTADAFEQIRELEMVNYWGFGLKYSLDTFIGPISLIGDWSNLRNSFGVYFSLGYSF